MHTVGLPSWQTLELSGETVLGPHVVYALGTSMIEHLIVA